MAGAKKLFHCQECGHTSVRWLGRCPECQQWNTFLETTPDPGGRGRSVGGPGGSPAAPISGIDGSPAARITTGLPEMDRVLGGGVVPGSVTLIGGEPGIGKSTLLLQVMAGLARGGRRVLYISGEESAGQIRMRGERIGTLEDGLLILVESNLERAMAEIERVGPEVLVVDSVQAVYSDLAPSPPGTIVQVREVARQITSVAKTVGIPAFIIGHVTKEGNLAGPKMLEHMVDTVLYFEGDSGHLYRLVRAIKNRYGSTNEVGIFRMGEGGLEPVENPSALFMGGTGDPQPGTVVVPSLEGQRPILVEIQSLVSATTYASGRRSVSGFDLNQVIMLLAVLEKRAGLAFGSSDVYVNAGGGMRLVEPAADLAILTALASGMRNVPLEKGTAVFGEVSLTGEIRGVGGAYPRLKEAWKLGFRRCVLPSACRDQVKKRKLGIELIFVGQVADALDVLGM